jgi:hypothetical protein
VGARARVLFWRWLNKRCRMSYRYNAITPFRELFDCPSYITYFLTCNILSFSTFSFFSFLVTWQVLLLTVMIFY